MNLSTETHVYVLACAGVEDIAKVGVSHQPLVRWQSFHPRWFEAFDLDASWLLRFETRREARACETRFHRALAAHRCPAPLQMPMVAGGRTEWFRGVQEVVASMAADAVAAGGEAMHGLVPWTTARMREEQARPYELLAAAAAMAWDGTLHPVSRRGLLDLVDAHASFDASVPERYRELLAPLRNAAGD